MLSVLLDGLQLPDGQRVLSPAQVKDCRIGDYNGKTLSTLNMSTVNIDPDVPQAGTLRTWWVLGLSLP